MASERWYTRFKRVHGQSTQERWNKLTAEYWAMVADEIVVFNQQVREGVK